MMRDAVETRGLSSLVAKDGQEAIERTVDELEGGDHKKNFDPLMSMHWHFTNEAIRCGGLYLMGESDSAENDRQYCPVCEFVKHQRDFDPKQRIETVADQMAKWARSEGLIPQKS